MFTIITMTNVRSLYLKLARYLNSVLHCVLTAILVSGQVSSHRLYVSGIDEVLKLCRIKRSLRHQEPKQKYVWVDENLNNPFRERQGHEIAERILFGG